MSGEALGDLFLLTAVVSSGVGAVVTWAILTILRYGPRT